jgi:catechol 2,3-dioxygenase-like lactoylglutathione lyase family enzyme
MRLNQVTVPVLDVDASIEFYRLLGLRLIVRDHHYARFVVPDGEATFSIHLAERVPADGAPQIYFECEDLDARVAELSARGVAFDAPPADQTWLWREAWLRDPSGNRLCLYWAGENRLNPPWRVQEG